ncbi:hypothetical protein [uncultured Corynebacterium sp.]|uniref:hypothetical protein n=1 Tax=uncultured Corynebacterium sp. TaxID=159447 RepID=UPI003458683C
MLLRRWALYCAVALALSGCSSEPAQEPTPVVPVTVESPQVVEDAASFFFEAPQRVAVAAADPAAQQAAARYAVAEGIPMLADAANATRVAHIEVFGAPALPDLGDAEVSEHEVSADATADRAAAAIELAGADSPTPASGVTALVTAATPLADVASARAAGARVLVLPVGDPRATADSLAAAAEGNVVALGPDFGSQETFARAAGLARNGELPGGGLVFPGRRMVALYGHPSDGALGALGEQDPAASVARVRELAAQYQELSAEPVVPAFEIIATVASGAPRPGRRLLQRV